MKWIGEFRDPHLARGLVAAIHAAVDRQRPYRLMEFCGGHTHVLYRHGLPGLMPTNVTFVHGPGCPVCVLPPERIDAAIHLSQQAGVVLCTYADLLRVPGSGGRSLQTAKSRGADVRMVGSTRDALALARSLPGRDVVMMAIGFETTTPASAAVLREARDTQVGNFSLLCNHVLTPPAIMALFAPGDAADALPIDGILGPAHVSAIIGTRPYEVCARAANRPVVIAGFEPLDLLMATLMLIRQINDGRCDVENEYTRLVDRDGNRKAQALMAEVMVPRERFVWRGLGELPHSALALRPEFAPWDAEARFDWPHSPGQEVRGCLCPDILRGRRTPIQCPLFGSACTPETPVGACMVSSEGACAAWWHHRPGRNALDRASREGSS
ncbi:MAG: hydrogenase formation protein HypD [Magnetococcus sp. WYHC-3]